MLKRLENGWKEVERMVRRGKGLEKMVEEGGDGMGRGMILLAESRRRCEVIFEKMLKYLREKIKVITFFLYEK